MKPILSIFFVFIISFTVYSQEFSANWNSVPAIFRGHDFESIYNALLSSLKQRERDKSETVTRYSEPVSQLKALRLGGKLTTDDALVFAHRPPLSTKETSYCFYDGDKGIFSVKIPVASLKASVKESNGKKQKKEFLAIQVLPMKVNVLGGYPRRTEYGSLPDVTQYATYQYSLAINNINDLANYRSKTEFEYSFALPSTEANGLKENLVVLYVFKLSPPYLTATDFNIKPSIGRPMDIQSYNQILFGNISDIWLFDRSTGKIYLKVKPNN